MGFLRLLVLLPVAAILNSPDASCAAPFSERRLEKMLEKAILKIITGDLSTGDMLLLKSLNYSLEEVLAIRERELSRKKDEEAKKRNNGHWNLKKKKMEKEFYKDFDFDEFNRQAVLDYENLDLQKSWLETVEGEKGQEGVDVVRREFDKAMEPHVVFKIRYDDSEFDSSSGSDENRRKYDAGRARLRNTGSSFHQAGLASVGASAGPLVYRLTTSATTVGGFEGGRSEEDRIQGGRNLEKGIQESRNLEKGVPESRDLEKRILESRNLEKGVPESRDLEKRILESRNLESRVPESRNLESRVPESGNLESRVPESRNLESRVPESGIPESRNLENTLQLSRNLENSLQHPKTQENRVQSTPTQPKPVTIPHLESSTADPSPSLEKLPESKRVPEYEGLEWVEDDVYRVIPQFIDSLDQETTEENETSDYDDSKPSWTSEDLENDTSEYQNDASESMKLFMANSNASASSLPLANLSTYLQAAIAHRRGQGEKAIEDIKSRVLALTGRFNATTDANQVQRERLTMFSPSCQAPRNTDQEAWSDQFSMNMHFQLNLTSAEHVVAAKLRIFKLPQENATGSGEPALEEDEEDEKKIRISVYYYTKSLKRHRSKKRLMDSVVTPLTSRGTHLALDVRQGLRFWRPNPRNAHGNQSNHGLVIQVEDQDGRPLKPALYIQQPSCSSQDSDQKTTDYLHSSYEPVLVTFAS